MSVEKKSAASAEGSRWMCGFRPKPLRGPPSLRLPLVSPLRNPLSTLSTSSSSRASTASGDRPRHSSRPGDTNRCTVGQGAERARSRVTGFVPFAGSLRRLCGSECRCDCMIPSQAWPARRSCVANRIVHASPHSPLSLSPCPHPTDTLARMLLLLRPMRWWCCWWSPLFQADLALALLSSAPHLSPSLPISLPL